jgi:hypothetical protein
MEVPLPVVPLLSLQPMPSPMIAKHIKDRGFRRMEYPLLGRG